VIESEEKSGSVSDSKSRGTSAIVTTALLLLSGISIAWALYFVFMVVPNEKVMGAVQRIFYFHVGSAFACYLAFFVVLGCAIWYLATHSLKADFLMEAAGEVGFIFCSICLGSGMIWGYVAWGVPFEPEPRLVSTLLLWLIFLSFSLLRIFGDTEKIRSHSAVLGILGALTVPVVVYSIELLPQFQRVHPRIIDQGGLKSPLFYQGLMYASLALILLEGLLIALRYRLSKLYYRVDIEGLEQ
jgi:heme exporter protein C